MNYDVKTPAALLTPEDLYIQAQRFGVDLSREPYLLPVMKQAATTPNPPKRQHDHDNSDGEHYFLDQIKIIRHRQQQSTTHKQDGEEFAWLAFQELVSPEESSSIRSPTSTYYYNFITKSRQNMHPLVPLLGENECAGNDDTDPVMRAADPREFENADTLHKQTSMRKYDSPNVFTISHIAHSVTGVPLSVWDLHEGARLTVLGRPTTLRQASLLTRQWLDIHERRLRPIMENLQKELAKYELRSHGRSAAALASGRILCADPHRSRSGVSLRQLLDDIVMLQTKLATYRPDLARRLCEPLADLDTA
ncbi:unnamed protein product [Phytophthora fragariaefolia]|uniref:Unnamed protein product n=1 Tax=Phytophthora fragariaefolia TaxID=1490495 RepID=A0A9W7DAL4_9STRA|nr:unnamed protein product [Phytophthora fragariaefolia]